MLKLRLCLRTPLLAVCILTPLNLVAQEAPPDVGYQAPTGLSINIGAGTILSPNYNGDDAYSLSSVPFIRVTKDDKFFASVETGMGYAVINQDGFRVGPLAQINFGRNEDGEGPFRITGSSTSDLIGLGDINTIVSVGGFADYKIGDITLAAKAGQALGGHDGLTGEVSLTYNPVLRDLGPPIFLSLGPRINYGDADYTQSFFGITPSQSLASGLPVYRAGGGVESYGMGGLAILPLSQKASVTFIGSYNRLTGDAADSPLIRQRGSKDQLFFGLITAYKIK